MKLAEKSAREREKREQERRELQESKAILAATEARNKQIEVEPIIETIPSETRLTQPRKSYGKIANGNHHMNTTEDLLRFTPPPIDQQSATNFPGPSTPNALPAKLQQMSGPSGPIRKSTKAKW